MKVADVLRKAKALIETPEKWCKGFMVRDGRYCALGALLTANEKPVTNTEIDWCNAKVACGYKELDQVMPPEVDTVGVFEYNDGHNHSDVMARFDEAIALAEREG